MIQPTPEARLQLFRTMLRIRMVEERIAEVYPQQEMRCPCHLSIGQEAVSAGACAALTREDLLFGTYRAHGIYLAKGGGLKALIAELYGKKTGCTHGRGGSMQLIAPEAGLICTSAIVSGTIPIAVGAALSIQIRRTRQVAMAVFGDGATEEGAFHESLNFASLKRLPVVFVCENNFYATYSHQSARQCADNVYQRAAAYEIPSVRVDGNDVKAVYEATREAVHRAREGQGPSLLECRTYRWRAHVGPSEDTHLGYRSPEEVEAWKARCPVGRWRKELESQGILTQPLLRQMEREIHKEIDDAFAFAKESPTPDAEDLLHGVTLEMSIS